MSAEDPDRTFGTRGRIPPHGCQSTVRFVLTRAMSKKICVARRHSCPSSLPHARGVTAGAFSVRGGTGRGRRTRRSSPRCSEALRPVPGACATAHPRAGSGRRSAPGPSSHSAARAGVLLVVHCLPQASDARADHRPACEEGLLDDDRRVLHQIDGTTTQPRHAYGRRRPPDRRRRGTSDCGSSGRDRQQVLAFGHRAQACRVAAERRRSGLPPFRLGKARAALRKTSMHL